MPNILENNFFILKYFDDLTINELYDILQLRESVFQIEQNCIYKDIDDKDKKSYHILLYQQQELVAYARLLPKNISYKNYCSIGRVVTNNKYRKEKLGIVLMQEAMKNLKILFPNEPIKISAQFYLIAFYEKFGFVVNSEKYLEDEIWHIEMKFEQ